MIDETDASSLGAAPDPALEPAPDPVPGPTPVPMPNPVPKQSFWKKIKVKEWIVTAKAKVIDFLNGVRSFPASVPETITGWHESLENKALKKRTERWKSWDNDEKKKKGPKEHRGLLFFNWLRNYIKDKIRYLLDPDHKKLYNGKLNFLAALFISLYILVTVSWMILFAFPGIGQTFSWNDYISIMLLLGVLHVWRYAILKNYKSIEIYEGLFPGNRHYHKEILPKIKNLAWPFPWTKGCTGIEITIKTFFFVLWFAVMVIVAVCCYELHIFGLGAKNKDVVGTCITFVAYFLLAIGVLFNYVSYYFSIVFCFFTREIANAKDIECECKVPWNSKYLRDLVHISSRTSMSFFSVSMMYLLVVVISVVAEILEIRNEYIDPDQANELKEALSAGNNYRIILLGATVFLCGISFIIISLLPKIFLNRLFRRWKQTSVDNIARDRAKVRNEEKDAYDEKISKVWASNMPFVRMEIASAFVTFAIDFSSLVVCILQLVK